MQRDRLSHLRFRAVALVPAAIALGPPMKHDLHTRGGEDRRVIERTSRCRHIWDECGGEIIPIILRRHRASPTRTELRQADFTSNRRVPLRACLRSSTPLGTPWAKSTGGYAVLGA